MTYEPDPEVEAFGLLTGLVQRGRQGRIGLPVGRDRAGVIADVADRIQELFQEAREAWGEARPPCPGHTHPAVALALGRAAK